MVRRAMPKGGHPVVGGRPTPGYLGAMSSLDLSYLPTQPFSPTEVHPMLQTLAGRWHGTTRTWLDPAEPPAVATIEAEAEVILGGRFVRLTYASTVMGGPHAGQLLLGYSASESQLTVVWIDSFHTSPAIMTSVGPTPREGKLMVLGSYAAGPERWGWKTEISHPAAGEILIVMTNVAPDGGEYPGVELRLSA